MTSSSSKGAGTTIDVVHHFTITELGQRGKNPQYGEPSSYVGGSRIFRVMTHMFLSIDETMKVGLCLSKTREEKHRKSEDEAQTQIVLGSMIEFLENSLWSQVPLYVGRHEALVLDTLYADVPGQ